MGDEPFLCDEDLVQGDGDTLEVTPAEYGEKLYWDARYATSISGQTVSAEIYDWYQEYANCARLRCIISEHTENSDHFLVIGCGNSTLSEQMYQDGYLNITSIDFSGTVIETMRKRAAELGLDGLVYLDMDARSMTFLDDTFDCVIDKGTIDAMMCGKDNVFNVERTCLDVSRVLKPGGVFIVISYGQPESRMELFNDFAKFAWSVETELLAKQTSDSSHFVYIMKKDIHANGD